LPFLMLIDWSPWSYCSLLVVVFFMYISFFCEHLYIYLCWELLRFYYFILEFHISLFMQLKWLFYGMVDLLVSIQNWFRLDLSLDALW
jgi:hypothetical protein